MVRKGLVKKIFKHAALLESSFLGSSACSLMYFFIASNASSHLLCNLGCLSYIISVLFPFKYPIKDP